MFRTALPLLLAISLSASAEVENEIPFGVEVVTGFRSDLIERGFKLGENILDVQLQSEVTLNNEWTLGFGALQATASGSSAYEESRGFLQLYREHGALRYGWTAAYRDVQSDIWRDGWETGPYFSVALNDDVAAGMSYLHARSHIHGDLRSPNLFVGADGKVMQMSNTLSGKRLGECKPGAPGSP
jgi:hypothetical protein